MNNHLMLSHDNLRVNRDQLRFVPMPKSTMTHKPIPHFDVAEIIVDQAEDRGFSVISEEYGLNQSGTKMFGVLRFRPKGHPEFSRALGVRNSHDKTLALGLTVGVNILVCSNLCFGGETTIHRKHTSGIDISGLIPRAFDSLDIQYVKLENDIQELKAISLNLPQAKLLVVKAAERKAIPSCDILSVIEEFKRPRHEEFIDMTQWSLFNAFTELAKKYSPARADKCYRELGKLFGLA